jgi:replicative DNA helicase
MRGDDFEAIMRLANRGSAPKIAMPHNDAAERSLIGMLLDRNTVFDKVSGILKAEHFADAALGRAYETASRLIAQGRTADRVTLATTIGKEIDLSELPSTVPSGSAVESYAATIFDCWRRRTVIETALKAAENAADMDIDGGAETAIGELEESLIALHDHGTGKQSRSLGDAARDAIAAAERAYKLQGRVSGVTTGFIDLDKRTGGLQPGNLVLLGGRPSMGKSSLARCIGINAARAGHPVLIASLEMSDAQVGGAAISSGTGIGTHRFATGDLDIASFERMVSFAGELDGLPVKITDDGSMTVARLRAEVRRFLLGAAKLPGVGHNEGQPNIPLVVCDYLQLFTAETKRRNGTRNDDVEQISHGLKAIARDFNIPVLVCAQLSRSLESRESKRPMLSDLRDSGSLEQDADVIMFLFREEYYLSRNEPTRQSGDTNEKYNDRLAAWEQNVAAARNLAEVILAKQRLGATGKVVLHFDAETTTFSNLAPQAAEPRGPIYSSVGD